MPAWAVAAIIFVCPVGQSTCQQQSIGLERAWCGKQSRGWVPQMGGEVRVTVRCKP
jgi:hypothetical protein